MPRTIRFVDQRAVTVKMTLEIMRLFCSAYFRADLYGSRAADFVLVGAVFVGQAEGRPLNASKIADFAGLPRATAIRRLIELEQIGIVKRHGKTYTIDRAVANSDAVLDAGNAARRQIVDTAARLSKMDTEPIAAKARQALA